MVCFDSELRKSFMVPTISIIVPSYNSEKYLAKVIRSLCHQTLTNIEIILVDDCSTDNTYELCLFYQKQDQRIKVIRLERNKGVSAARNMGLSLATGRYIAFVDSDDWIASDMMEYLLKLIEKNNADISTCEICKEFQNGKKTILGSHREYLIDAISAIDSINFNNDFTCYIVDKLYKRDILEGIQFHEDLSIGEVYRFLMEIMIKNPKIVHGGECKYYYQQIGTSVTHKGFASEKEAVQNRVGYRSTFELLCRYNSCLKESALAHYILEEMAVVISMAKAKNYNKVIIDNIQFQVRKYLKNYLQIRQVPFYLKVCALLLSLNEKLLLYPYQLLSHIQSEF